MTGACRVRVAQLQNVWPPVGPSTEHGLEAAFGGGIDWKTSTGEDRYGGVFTPLGEGPTLSFDDHFRRP